MIRIKKLFTILALLTLMISQTGCDDQLFGRTEMKRIEFIRAIGIDKIDNEDKVRLIVATQSIKPGSNGGGQEKQSETIYADGTTVFETFRNLWTYMDKRPFLGHLDYIIIGEDAAKSGILKYIDFFSRDPEIRLNLKVYIAKESTAEEIIKQANKKDKFIFDQLEGLNNNEIGQSVSNAVDLIETMYSLVHEYASLYLPCIELQNFTISQQDTENNQDIVMQGFAVFRNDKLIGYLDARMGRGLNWLKNNIKSGIIPVSSQEGSSISLEIIGGKTKIKPEITDNGLIINVLVLMSSNIGEIRSSEDIFTSNTLEYLEEQQEQVIKQEIESVIKYAQDNKLDFIGAANAVLHKYPIQWEDIYQENWSEKLPQTKFNVVVDSVIYRTYDILESTKS